MFKSVFSCIIYNYLKKTF